MPDGLLTSEEEMGRPSPEGQPHSRLKHSAQSMLLISAMDLAPRVPSEGCKRNKYVWGAAKPDICLRGQPAPPECVDPIEMGGREANTTVVGITSHASEGSPSPKPWDKKMLSSALSLFLSGAPWQDPDQAFCGNPI